MIPHLSTKAYEISFPFFGIVISFVIFATILIIMHGIQEIIGNEINPF